MMMLHYAYVGVALIALALLAAWMFVASRRHLMVRICGALAAVVLAFGIWINITAVLGYAVAEMPRGNARIIGYYTDVDHGKIYLWVSETDGPRAYVVPYDASLSGDLIKGASDLRREGGGTMFIDDHAGHGMNVKVVPALPEKE